MDINGYNKKIEDYNKIIDNLKAERSKITCEIDQKIRHTEDLITIAKREYEKNILFPKIRAKIDELFALPENENCNIIVLNNISTDFNGRDVYYDNNPWSSIDNISIVGNTEYNNWATAIEWSENNEKILDEIFDLGVTGYFDNANTLYRDDSSINCYWYGFVALTKDYKAVSFICRNDNMMLNHYEKAPDILFDFSVKEEVYKS